MKPLQRLPEGTKARCIKGVITIVDAKTLKPVKVTRVARPVAVAVSSPVSAIKVVAKLYNAAPVVTQAPVVDYGAKGSLGNNRGFSLLR